MNNLPHLSLWRWLCLRIFSLAIGSMVLIAICMWLRYAIWNLWVIHSMPEAVRHEFAALQSNPDLNRIRYYEILDTWYGPKSFDLSIASEDWMTLGILVLVAIPLIVMLGMWATRPLSVQFSQLAVAARAVARGQFATRARMVPGAPAELTLLTRDFNVMTAQLERYERELHASHVAMAHELRSPLTAAMGRLQGMLDGVFEPDAQQLQMVMNQMLNLNRLIEDLHLLSMASAGQLVIDKTRLNPVELLRDRIAWLKPNAEAAGFAITLHADEEGDCLADPLRLGQVFTILMDNALRYAVEGKAQHIDVVRRQNRWRIRFRDYGPGVSEVFLPYIFERFSRADTSRARHSGGSGLGLSIALAICEALGGSLTAENHLEGGMCFILELPTA
ncbi:sensor histidine kinase [Dickeya solani]|uniref:histidine kinase n=2 Tax=Dickeya solani TaxID=1089444 RepID=A0ABU4EDS6_9GAMM|nr:ATP-binding protein [Dickeya solani]ANE76264.1 two-component sensor histidine kinase [Dickeya solani IPO 2222]AUC43851.1 two-component system sensor protein [Dickeya solani RNS 08.23.3.1.A]AUH08327.1 two-component sensor histidine kinase [Dickeya solani D s0432-1]AUH12332.1 two-component sensor histidine kinase [Dickeya solani]AYQ46735.1 Signal transduction histidine-protein kinase BaeS [Dickeya solani]